MGDAFDEGVDRRSISARVLSTMTSSVTLSRAAAALAGPAKNTIAAVTATRRIFLAPE
jgi:hypothetical protein